jgi:hypothetical protein
MILSTYNNQVAEANRPTSITVVAAKSKGMFVYRAAPALSELPMSISRCFEKP